MLARLEAREEEMEALTDMNAEYETQIIDLNMEVRKLKRQLENAKCRPFQGTFVTPEIEEQEVEQVAELKDEIEALRTQRTVLQQ